MRTIGNSRRRTQFVWLQTKRIFRDETVTIGRGPSAFLSVFPNKFWNYRMITKPLAAATYKFAVAVKDSENNVSNINVATATVGTFTMPPRFTAFVYTDTDEIKLTWKRPVSGTPDNYIIYSNNGSGGAVTAVPYATIGGSLLQYTISSLSAGVWRFKVEAVKNAIISDTEFIVEMIIPRTANPPPPPVDADMTKITVNAENVSIGKLKISFLWKYGSQAEHFRIYHDSGTGVVSYGSYIEFDRVSGYDQTYTTSQLYFGTEAQEFIFVLRAVSPDGIEESNTVEHTVNLRGVAPDEVENIAAESVY